MMEENEIKVSGFYIHYPGEKSVGIYPSTFELMGECYFDDRFHLKEFKSKLLDLFVNHVSDEACFIMTAEEYFEQEKTMEPEFQIPKFTDLNRIRLLNYRSANTFHIGIPDHKNELDPEREITGDFLKAVILWASGYKRTISTSDGRKFEVQVKEIKQP